MARRRQELPWVPVEKDYRFTTRDGERSLADLFEGRSEKIEEYRQRMGWTFPWASSAGSDFNFDFGVSFRDGERANAEYNFGAVQHDGRYTAEELPGMSAFALGGGQVFHTYSAYARGLDALWGMYQWLDRTPKGRNEDAGQEWIRRHDEYEGAAD